MYMNYFVTITSQGQLTIPAAIRKELSLDVTRKVVIRSENNSVVIEPVRDISEFKGIFATAKRYTREQERKAFEEALAHGKV